MCCSRFSTIGDASTFTRTSDETLASRMYSNLTNVVRGESQTNWGDRDDRESEPDEFIASKLRTERSLVMALSMILNVGHSRTDTPQRRWERRRSVLT